MARFDFGRYNFRRPPSKMSRRGKKKWKGIKKSNEVFVSNSLVEIEDDRIYDIMNNTLIRNVDEDSLYVAHSLLDFDSSGFIRLVGEYISDDLLITDISRQYTSRLYKTTSNRSIDPIDLFLIRRRI